MNLRQLEYVVALNEHRNFRRAAFSAGISQSALTQSIKQLEAEYGVALFKRDTRDVAPTAFGEAVIATAKETLQRLENLDREIEMMKNLNLGHLVVGCETLLSEALIAPALARLMKRYPDLRFTIRVASFDDLIADLVASRIDLYIGVSPNKVDDRFDWIKMDLPGLVVACRPDHPLLDKDVVSIADCQAYPSAVPRLPHWYLDWVNAQFRVDGGEGDAPNRPFFLESDNYGVIRWLVRHTDTITAILPSLVAEDVRSGLLRTLRLEGMTNPVPAGVGTLARRALQPAAEALIAELLVEVGQQWAEAETLCI